MFVLVTLKKFPEFTRYVGRLQAVFHGMKAGNLEAVILRSRVIIIDPGLTSSGIIKSI